MGIKPKTNTKGLARVLYCEGCEAGAVALCCAELEKNAGRELQGLSWRARRGASHRDDLQLARIFGSVVFISLGGVWPIEY